ncbi:hypothetical protein evm_012297 [Chilo suppressalis]|nr:hypothetical protein evm_012297 [Chilo suppressalis]
MHAQEFTDVLLSLGKGTLPEEREALARVVSSLEELIRSVYGDISRIPHQRNSWVCERAILTSKITRLHECILSKLRGLKCGLSAHIVKLKVGVPIMLLQNLSHVSLLCNKTRLKVNSLHRHTIEAEILTGCGDGEAVTPAHRLQLYKAQVRPHMEYCSHLWAGPPQYQLLPLDRIQRRPARIVDDQDLSDQLDPLALRRDVASLCIFYRIYHGECSEELFGLIPAAAFRHRTSRQKFHPHHLDAWLSTTQCFRTDTTQKPSKRERAPFLKAGIVFVILLVLQVSMGDGDHFPSGEPSAPLIPRFYAGREVFITGATGFVGQVLTERLLSTCPDISCLHLLVRVKENESLKTKLNKIKDLQLFDVLRGNNPKQLEKLNLIPGDITRPNLGLNETSVAELHNVSVVFHLAATIKFNEQLEVAVKINTLGPMCLLDICDRLPKMAALIHVSTAYCEAERALIEEAVYPLPRDLDTMIQESLHGGRRTELQLKRFLSPKMNTYMLTKSMAESAIKLHGNRGYPIAILRPSIVASSLRDPFPGWVQGFQGAVGIVTNVSLGLMRVMGCRPDYPIDLLPVDIAADTAIAVAWETAVDNLQEVRVYNCCTMENPINYGDAFRYMVQEAREYPSSSIMWYPFIFHASKSYILKPLEFLLEVIPMYVAEYAMKTFGNKGKRCVNLPNCYLLYLSLLQVEYNNAVMLISRLSY